MIDLSYDYKAQPSGCCECGDPQCDGDAKWLAQATADIAEALVDIAPELNSPLLKLVKERNEARELVRRMLAAVDGVTGDKEYYDAMLAAHRAAMLWKGGAQ